MSVAQAPGLGQVGSRVEAHAARVLNDRLEDQCTQLMLPCDHEPFERRDILRIEGRSVAALWCGCEHLLGERSGKQAVHARSGITH